MSTTTVLNAEAQKRALVAAGEEAFYALTEDVGHAEAIATMCAAIAYEGWSGKSADRLLSFVADGADEAELKAAKRAAASISSPWSAWSNLSEDASGHARTFRRHLQQVEPGSGRVPDPGGTMLDLEAPAQPPRWLVPDFLVRGKVHMLSGATGSMKSGLRTAMMAASLTGTPFLGREVEKLRWLVIDGENSRDDLRALYKALGITTAHLREDVHLTTREKNVRLGEEEWDSWLRREIESFRPDVLIIDTVARCCAGIDGRSEDSVAEFFGDVLVPLVDHHDLALLYTAHHRKSGGRAGTDEAVLGSTQWAGQAEQTVTVAYTGPLTMKARADGGKDTHRNFVVRRPKGRALVENVPEHFTVTGQLDSSGALVDFKVSAPAGEPTPIEQLVGALAGQPLGSGALAEALGMNRTAKKYMDLRDEAVGAGLIEKNADGLYEVADA